MAETKAVNLKLDAELVKRLDHLAVDYDVFRADLIEAMLLEAVEKTETGEWDIAEVYMKREASKQG